MKLKEPLMQFAQDFIQRVDQKIAISRNDLNEALKIIQNGLPDVDLSDRLQIAYLAAITKLQEDFEANANKNIASLNGQIVQLQTDVNSERGRANSNQVRINALLETIETLRTSITNLSTQVSTLKESNRLLAIQVTEYVLKEKIRFLQNEEVLIIQAIRSGMGTRTVVGGGLGVISSIALIGIPLLIMTFQRNVADNKKIQEREIEYMNARVNLYQNPKLTVKEAKQKAGIAV
jgi:hypothetical protein